MKTILLFFIPLSFLFGCSTDKRELFKETDAFIESLDVFYESYGILGGGNHSVVTSDGRYKITPFGKIIKIKIQNNGSKSEYEKLRKEIANHYKDNNLVHDVLVENKGPIMIDCRK